MPRTPFEKLSIIQQTVLVCVGDYPAHFTRSGAAKLLVGSRSTRAADSATNPYYGRLAEYGRKEITFEIDILLQQGYLALDHKNRLNLAGSPPIPTSRKDS